MRLGGRIARDGGVGPYLAISSSQEKRRPKRKTKKPALHIQTKEIGGCEVVQRASDKHLFLPHSHATLQVNTAKRRKKNEREKAH